MSESIGVGIDVYWLALLASPVLSVLRSVMLHDQLQRCYLSEYFDNFFSDPHLESHGISLEGKGGDSAWSGASDCQVGLGQQPRPRAFSQSAVHTLEQREKERDLEKVGDC